MNTHAAISELEQIKLWDAILTDIETRTEQLRQLKTFEPRKLLLSGITTGAAVFGSGAAFLGLLLHWMGRL